MSASSTTQSNRAVSPAVSALLEELFDFAGLFPPACQSMNEAIAEYQRLRASDYGWLVSRFIVPEARLPEFLTTLAKAPALETNFQLSVLCRDGQPSQATLAAVAQSKHCSITAIESKWSNAHVATPTLPTYVELNWDEPRTTFQQLRHSELRAKFRTGGLEQTNFPTTTSLARCLLTCQQVDLTFKATAGLHHPLAGRRPAHGGSDAPTVSMHGFLNLLFATTIAQHESVDESVLIAILAETKPTAFNNQNDAITWRDFNITTEQIRHTRSTRLHSIGSCSIAEPITDLIEMGWLSESAEAPRNSS